MDTSLSSNNEPQELSLQSRPQWNVLAEGILAMHLGRLALGLDYQLTNERCQVYQQALGDVPIEHLEEIADRWLMGTEPTATAAEQCRFPLVSQLRRACAVGSRIETTEAFERVLSFMRREGVPYGSGGSAALERFVLLVPMPVRETVIRLGSGDLKGGFEYIRNHPFFGAWDDDYGMKLASDIEERFKAVYERTCLLHPEWA